jgi:hypothetical protein
LCTIHSVFFPRRQCARNARRMRSDCTICR